MGYARSDLDGEKLRKALRENLRKFRTEADYSQEEIARLLGVTRPTYTYYETGKTTPSVTDLYQLSRLYHRAMEEFFQQHKQRKKAEEHCVPPLSLCLSLVNVLPHIEVGANALADVPALVDLLLGHGAHHRHAHVGHVEHRPGGEL